MSNDARPEINAGQQSDDLLPQVYHELRRLAQNRLRQEGPQTLTATSLVHEAYLRLSPSELQWDSPRHFFAAAAGAMRRILIDRARAKKQLKRGGDRQRLELSDSQIIAPAEDEQLLSIDEALRQLEREDPESAELVNLRYFAGMTWDEISDAIGIPERTLRRRWTYARSWLQERLARD